MKINSICIDPGHGGDDNGAVWGYTEEDDTNLSVVYLLRCEFLQMVNGPFVYMTREKDEFVSLHDRTSMANSFNVDAFISIHCDAWHNETTKGISTHIYTKASNKSIELSLGIHNSLIDEFKDHVNRGIKRSNFHVLRETAMPAVLVECEFITNPEMNNFLREPFNQLRIARAIAKGVLL